MLNNTYFKRENIRDRLLKRSAGLWGYEESQLEHFDPLARLLIEACAVEFEKTGIEIQGTEARLTERLAELLCPDSRMGATPAYAVAQARPEEPFGHIHAETMLMHSRKTLQANQPKEVFFSPPASFPIVNASVRLIATQADLFEVSDTTGQKGIVRKALSGDGSKSVWLGLEIADSVKSWDGFRFFFHWSGHPGCPDLIPMTQWYAGGQQLTVKTGLTDEATQNRYEYDRDLLSVWEQRFVTIHLPGNSSLPAERSAYPAIFEQWFDQSALKSLRDPLLWLLVDFPSATPSQSLDTLTVSLNAFPVINRRLHKITYRLQNGLNGIALTSGEAFLGMHSVTNARGEAYLPSDSIRDSNDAIAGNYILRRRGMERFDERNARSALFHLLELLRDEQSSFSAIGEEFLSALLREMAQNIARLEQKIGTKQTFDTAAQPFLVVRAENQADTLYISYWTTLAESINGLPPGSPLAPYGSQGIVSGNVRLLTSPYGGKAPPTSRERVNELRRNLTTRNRLVTPEDIRVYCKAELGDRVNEVQVRHSYAAGKLPGQGFMKYLEILLSVSKSMTDCEWFTLEQDLLSKIRSRSAQILPFRLVQILPVSDGGRAKDGL